MSIISRLISFDNPAFNGYVTYGSVLVLKMMIMAPLTGRQRMKHAVPASPEDVSMLKGREILKSHDDVERVRRAHLNDLENIPIFFLAGFAYLLTDPDPTTALNLFRAYTLARCLHTFVYAVVVVPQPARGLAWGTGFFITGYMAIKAICHFKTF
ncbi:hypothetical protein ILUMI_24568 [Ignelater luminosus]|uniref:Microsomal glutathione S-transferase 1 n=1 Tax=Ignelater luminosus TaxID=2038154 RepID=A0A8K0FWJ5_IGNLU|nr:hypothetical protein ILUMI_24568 [Ignelater luminosus]